MEGSDWLIGKQAELEAEIAGRGWKGLIGRCDQMGEIAGRGWKDLVG